MSCPEFLDFFQLGDSDEDFEKGAAAYSLFFPQAVTHRDMIPKAVQYCLRLLGCVLFSDLGKIEFERQEEISVMLEPVMMLIRDRELFKKSGLPDLIYEYMNATTPTANP
jgi:hypothetical protein